MLPDGSAVGLPPRDDSVVGLPSRGLGMSSGGRALSEGMKDSSTLGIGEPQLIVIGLILVSALLATVAIILLGDWMMRRKWIFADGSSHPRDSNPGDTCDHPSLQQSAMQVMQHCADTVAQLV